MKRPVRLFLGFCCSLVIVTSRWTFAQEIDDADINHLDPYGEIIATMTSLLQLKDVLLTKAALENTTLVTELNDARGTIKILRERLATTNVTVAELREELKCVQERVQVEQKTNLLRVKMLEEQLATAATCKDIQGMVSAQLELCNVNRSMTAEMSELRVQVIDLNDKVSTLDQDKTNLQTQLSISQQREQVTLKELSSVRSNLSNVQQEADTLRTSTASIEQTLTELRKQSELQLKASEARVRELEAHIKQLNDNIQELNTTCTKWISKEKLMKTIELQMVLLGNNYYYFSSDKKNWSDARLFCRSHNLDLVSIETAEEDAFIYSSSLSRGLTFVWLGGTDAAQEGTWVWSATQQPLVYTHWRKGDPDGKLNQNCMSFYDGYKNEWIDNNCESKGNYVCEMNTV